MIDGKISIQSRLRCERMHNCLTSCAAELRSKIFIMSTTQWSGLPIRRDKSSIFTIAHSLFARDRFEECIRPPVTQRLPDERVYQRIVRRQVVRRDIACDNCLRAWVQLFKLLEDLSVVTRSDVTNDPQCGWNLIVDLSMSTKKRTQPFFFLNSPATRSRMIR